MATVKPAAKDRKCCFCNDKNANVGAQSTELTMRTLLIPAVGLAFALGLAAPTASFAHATSTGTTHTMHSKTHSKACHPTKTHHCAPAKKSTKSAKNASKSTY
jgi:hypothetical protein